MPESPHYLLAKGDRMEAMEALIKFRGKSDASVQRELEELEVIIFVFKFYRSKKSDFWLRHKNCLIIFKFMYDSRFIEYL